MKLQVVKVSKPVKRKNSKKKSSTKQSFIKGTIVYTDVGNYISVIDDKGVKRLISNLEYLFKISEVYFTLPCNDKHEPWTKIPRVPHMPPNYLIALKYWSPLPQGIAVSGVIDGSKFKITKVKGVNIYEHI